MTDSQKLTGDQIEAEGLSDWRVMFHALQTRYRTGNFATGLKLVNQIGAAAEEMGHHPDLDLRYPHLNIRLHSHDVFGVTQRDVRLARVISEFAADLGVSADPSVVSVVELALDTPDHTADQAVLARRPGSSRQPESGRGTARRRRRPADDLVPGHRSARDPASAVPSRRPGSSRGRAAADRGRPGSRGDAGQRRPGAGVRGAGRPRRQQGLRLHLAGSRLLSQHVGSTYRMLGRVTDWLDGNGARRRRWSHAQGHSCMHATRELISTNSCASPLVAFRPRGFLFD